MGVLRASRRIRGGNLSPVHSSTWVAALVAAVFVCLATGVAGQNASGYSAQIYMAGSPCVEETLIFNASLYPDVADKKYQWYVDQPDGAKATSTDPRLTHIARVAGTYTTSVIITDANGTKLGSDVMTFQVYYCEKAQSPAPTAHPDCYKEGYGYYYCDYPPGTTTPCYPYYDNRTGTYNQCSATPSPSPPSYNPDECTSLSQSQEEFYRQWKYEYYAHYERMGTAPGSDPTFEEDMRLRQERFDQDWQAQWSANGCDRPYSNPDCEPRWSEAKMALAALDEKWSNTWSQFYAQMERVRASWSTYTEDERMAFEKEWREGSARLSSQYSLEWNSIGDRYNLWECGFGAADASTRPDWELSGQAPPTGALVSIRSDCDERMAANKEIYIGEFETLRAKLEAEQPGTDAYETARQRLADLEEKLAAELEAILASCREDYRAQYDAPEDFRDGLGSLQCYYDQFSSKIRCEGTYVSFVGDPQTQFLSRFTCGGQPVFDDLYANHVFEDFEFIEDQDSASLLIRSENLKLIFHDGPRGVINFGAVGDAELYLVPSPHLSIEVVPNGLEMSSQGGWSGTFASAGPDAVTYDEVKGLIVVRGEATWIAQTCRPDGVDPDGDLGSDYYDAIKARRLGAQVTISFDGDRSEHDEEDYADMDIDVEHQGGKKFLATIDSPEGTCKTVVLKFNAGIFDTIKLNVMMTDESGDAIKVSEASNLEDVLDPCNDGDDGFEYWIVQDRHGTQVLVSFAHFSEKRVSVESASVGNVIVPGFDGITATFAVAFAALVFVGVRRRLTR